ncbi:rho GTPase-activating protein 20-like [Haemaphysalis longicornis]
MSTWARRVHRGATSLGQAVSSCGGGQAGPSSRLERVKFGVPLEQLCKDSGDLPAPLLVLMLCLNKEAPRKKDVFRAPGHQGNARKLAHFLHQGRLVNLDNFSVHTMASVLKRFLRKLPGGVFGPELEGELLTVLDQPGGLEERRERVQQLLERLPLAAQRLLVLLFGTFRLVASDLGRTGMTAEALGVSVAPSFFRSCTGKVARMEDVARFRAASRATRFLIDNFGVSNLFGRHNYEYYARLTGRVLRVEEDWIFAFRYPPDSLVPRKTSLEAERSWLQAEAQRWGLHQSAPALAELRADDDGDSSAAACPLERQQAQRLRTRSEWFLGDKENGPPPHHHPAAVVSEQDCTELDVRTFHVTLTYQPRI